MAKKQAPTPQTAMDLWQEITQRASLTDYRNVNGVIIGTNGDGNLVLMIPDPALLTLLLDPAGEVKPYDQEDPETADYLPWFDYGRKLDEGWLDIDADELYAGKTITIRLDETKPKTFISKDSLPLKLKKAEFSDLAYRVFAEDKVLGIMKRFVPLPEHGFTVLKLFQII